jgi:uncharacterized paraquat-inducible protein A
MPIQVTCNVCGAKFEAPNHLAGKAANCPRCNDLLRVPDADPTSAGQFPSEPASSSQAPAAVPRQTQSQRVAIQLVIIGVFTLLGFPFVDWERPMGFVLYVVFMAIIVTVATGFQSTVNRLCPHCMASIPKAAAVCKYCTRDVTPLSIDDDGGL